MCKKHTQSTEFFSSESLTFWYQRTAPCREQGKAPWKYGVSVTTVKNKSLLQFTINKVCVICILMKFVSRFLKYIDRTIKNWILEYM